jgi:hypothetical protein
MRDSMKAVGAVAAVLAALTLGATIWLALLAGMPLAQLGELFLGANLVVQMLDIVLFLWTVAIVVICLVVRNPAARLAYSLISIGPVAIGGLACLYGVMDVWMAATRVHVTRLDIVAPDLAESLLPLGVGLTLTALALLVAPRREPEAA